MSNYVQPICLTTGTGLPQEPYQVLATEEISSSQVTAYLRDHVQRLAAKQGWLALEILETQLHKHGLKQLYAIEVNYEMDEGNQTEYYSSLIWYDITQPYTQIEAQTTVHH